MYVQGLRAMINGAWSNPTRTVSSSSLLVVVLVIHHPSSMPGSDQACYVFQDGLMRKWQCLSTASRDMPASPCAFKLVRLSPQRTASGSRLRPATTSWPKHTSASMMQPGVGRLHLSRAGLLHSMQPMQRGTRLHYLLSSAPGRDTGAGRGQCSIWTSCPGTIDDMTTRQRPPLARLI